MIHLEEKDLTKSSRISSCRENRQLFFYLRI